MADKILGYQDDATTGSTPAGNGGRVRRRVYLNDEGIDASIDAGHEGNILVSGMTKRMALETGRFTDIDYRDED